MDVDRRNGARLVFHARHLHTAGEPLAPTADRGAGAALRAGRGNHRDHRTRPRARPRRLVDLDRKSPIDRRFSIEIDQAPWASARSGTMIAMIAAAGA